MLRAALVVGLQDMQSSHTARNSVPCMVPDMGSHNNCLHFLVCIDPMCLLGMYNVSLGILCEGVTMLNTLHYFTVSLALIHRQVLDMPVAS